MKAVTCEVRCRCWSHNCKITCIHSIYKLLESYFLTPEICSQMIYSFFAHHLKPSGYSLFFSFRIPTKVSSSRQSTSSDSYGYCCDPYLCDCACASLACCLCKLGMVTPFYVGRFVFGESVSGLHVQSEPNSALSYSCTTLQTAWV